MSDQTIFRAHRTERDRWTSLLNETIRDDRMSFRATGLLVYLLSLPPNWKANQGQIVTCKTEGRDAVVTAWNELRKLGYIHKELIREKGRIVTTIWNIYETPQAPDRLTEKPEADQPETVEPKPEEPPLRKTEENKEQKKRKVAGAPVDEPSIESKVVNMPPELDSDEFVAAFERWIANRRQRRIKPYTADGANAQLRILAVMGQARAIAAIEWSIAQGYQGIYEKNASNSNRQPLAASHSNAGTSNASAASQY